MLTAEKFDRQLALSPKMSYRRMLTALQSCPLHVTESVLPNNLCGLYSEELQTIIIDRNMSPIQKRCTLVHEALHWVHADDTCTPYEKTREEQRVLRETAMTLIQPDDYIRMERAYDGGISQMAHALNVTISVAVDYRSILEADAF